MIFTLFQTGRFIYRWVWLIRLIREPYAASAWLLEFSPEKLLYNFLPINLKWQTWTPPQTSQFSSLKIHNKRTSERNHNMDSIYHSTMPFRIIRSARLYHLWITEYSLKLSATLGPVRRLRKDARLIRGIKLNPHTTFFRRQTSLREEPLSDRPCLACSSSFSQELSVWGPDSRVRLWIFVFPNWIGPLGGWTNRITELIARAMLFQ